jgi:hypothetical protein
MRTLAELCPQSGDLVEADDECIARIADCIAAKDDPSLDDRH